jgi:hypothetical protein
VEELRQFITLVDTKMQPICILRRRSWFRRGQKQSIGKLIGYLVTDFHKKHNRTVK